MSEALDPRKVLNDLVTRGAASTADLPAFGLTIEQVKEFIKVFAQQGDFAGLVNWRMTGALSGHLPKFRVGARLLRGRPEGAAPATTVKPIFTDVAYALKHATLQYDVTEELLRYNVEGEALNDDIFQAYAAACGVDIIDLCWNGDTACDPADPDYLFLKVLDGWLKKLPLEGATVVNAAGLLGGAAIRPEVFNAAKRVLPALWKTRSKEFKWGMNPDLMDAYVMWLKNSPSSMGDRALIDGKPDSLILGRGWWTDSAIPVDTIVYADPKQFAVCYGANMELRSTREGVECVTENKRVNVLHGDYDPITYNADSVVLVENITGVV